MQLRRVLTDHDIVTLVALASKVCSETLLVKADQLQSLKQKQLELLKIETARVLSRLDKEAPSIIPVPSDGKPWAYRAPQSGMTAG